MKAAVFREVGVPLSIEEVELDPPKAGEVKVKIGAAGICRSDLHYMKGEAAIPRPAVLGHEGAGIAGARGSAIQRGRAGRRTVTHPRLRRTQTRRGGEVDMAAAERDELGHR